MSAHSIFFARILVADDFAAWRVRICEILSERTEWEIVAEACNGLEALQISAEMRPDLVLIDVRMPRLSGIEAAVQIQRVSPGSKIVFITHENDPEIRRAALMAGAHGFVLKANVESELLPTIANVLQDDHQRWL